MFTALNVARKCGIVPVKNRVIFVEAYPPFELETELRTAVNPNRSARIEWKFAECFKDFDDSDSKPNHLNSQVCFFHFLFNGNKF